MNLLAQLWNDESGVILSAEAAVVGTVAVIGVSAGLSVAATAVNQEMQDVAFAIRSLDQSYQIPGQVSCCANTAGSSFLQQPVEQSLQQLCGVAVEVHQESDEDSVEPSRAERRKSKDRKKKRKPQAGSDNESQSN